MWTCIPSSIAKHTSEGFMQVTMEYAKLVIIKLIQPPPRTNPPTLHFSKEMTHKKCASANHADAAADCSSHFCIAAQQSWVD